MSEFFPMLGYEGSYEISRGGVVRSCARAVNGKNLKPRVLKPNLSRSGYWRVTLSFEGVVRQREVHRILAETFIPRQPGKEQVNHVDGDKKNNDLQNLEWVTPKENMRHAYETGLIRPGEHFGRRGERHWKAKLGNEDIWRIRESNKSVTELASEYGVSHASISKIRHRLTWTHI